MTTTMEWPEQDGERPAGGGERETIEPIAPPSNVSDDDRAAHDRLMAAARIFADERCILPSVLMSLFANLHPCEMPRGKRHVDQQAREIWFYLRAQHIPSSAFDGTDVPKFADSDEETIFQQWMAWNMNREFVKPEKPKEDDNGPTP